MLHFNPIIVLFLTLIWETLFDGHKNNFNPIIVLFLTHDFKDIIPNKFYFNPIIVLFLTVP